MQNITNAYLQLEMCGIADLVVYERSKYGNMKEINTPHFKCLGFFLETLYLGLRRSMSLFSGLLVSWFMHFSVYHIHCILLAPNSK